MTQRSVAAHRRGHRPQPSRAGPRWRDSPLGRLVEPEEVAAAVVWLASAEAATINGQTLVLDGGGIQT